MTFKTIFEATPSQESLAWFPVIGVAFVFVGVLLVLKPQLYLNGVFPRVRASWGKPLSWIWLVFWSIWTAASFSAAMQGKSVPQSESYAVVEGWITNFMRMPYNGPSHGSFVVAGKQFTFSRIEPIPAEASITDGIYARVTFRERPFNRIEILRLQVADPNQ
jgi:hypothetical protein